MPILPNHHASPVDRDLYLWTARQAVRMHTEPADPHRPVGRCKQCQADGTCAMLAWAQLVLAPVGARPDGSAS